MKSMIYLADVATLRLFAEKCIGCSMCTVVCPHSVFQMVDGRAAIAQKDACMECGACAQNCPAEAIAVSTGVGCAAAVINSMLGRSSSSCCCSIDPPKSKDSFQAKGSRKKGSSCC